MKNLAASTILLAVLTGCAGFRTHSSFVAHVDNTNILLHEADVTAGANGCYASAETGEDRQNCVDKAVDELLDREFYSFYKRSMGVVDGLAGEGRVVLTDDGTAWNFTDNTRSNQAQ